MKAKLYFSLMFVCLCLCQSVSYSQCTDATYGQFPTNTYYCVNTDGTPEVINENCYAGEFSVVYVEMGFTYEFSSSIPTDYLTVVDDQLAPLTYGVSPVSYEAAFTGFVAFFTHVNSNCDESNTDRSRIVSCTDPGPCFNAPMFGQYPAQTFSSTICDGTTEETIDVNCAAGEYSKVSLLAGNTYHFSSDIASDYLTISDESGTSAIVYGFSPLEYVATVNQVVRFYTHVDTDCGESGSLRSRIVQCGPTFCYSEYQWPSDPYTMMACDGATENIAHDTYAGEYTLVNMDANKAYVLSSSVPTDYITVTSADGNTLFNRGYTPLTFEPTLTAQYRYIISSDIDCGVDAVDRDRNIACFTNLALEEQNEFGLSIYPNPATTFVTVSAKEKMDEIQIVSVDGKILSTVQPDSINTTLSLEHLQAGTYFVRVSIDGTTLTSEVIKQ